jgi:hypothetical protein
MAVNRGQERPLQRQRTAYAILLALALAFTLYEELHLRRWLYHQASVNKILPGSLPNFLAVVDLGLAYAVARLPQTSQAITQLVASVVAGLCLYEVVQIWLPHQVFDWYDIAATLLGGLTVWLLIYLPLPRP